MDTYICNIDIIIYYNRQYCIGTYLYFLSFSTVITVFLFHYIFDLYHIHLIPYWLYQLRFIINTLYNMVSVTIYRPFTGNFGANK